jgi:hypothetical protein
MVKPDCAHQLLDSEFALIAHERQDHEVTNFSPGEKQ